MYDTYLQYFLNLVKEQAKYFLLSAKCAWSFVCHPPSKQQGHFSRTEVRYLILYKRKTRLCADCNTR